MSTEKQTEANRLNAQKSTGPRTPDGKAKVAQNAVTHGLTALRPVLASESPEEYALFRDDFFRHHAPVGIFEESLAQRAADSFWRLQRAQDYETAVLNTLIQDAQNPQSDVACHSREGGNPDLLGQILLDDFRQTHCLEKVQKYEMAIERSFYRTVKELRLLQSLRLNVGEASVLHCNSANSKVGEASLLRYNSENSKNEKNKPNLPEGHRVEAPAHRGKDGQVRQNKPKIPSFDPIKLLENMKSNPIGLDPLTKIMMKSDRDHRLAKKAM